MYERHGDSGTRLYRIWRAMLERCYRTTHDSYLYYGGRGITVCEEWRISYTAFKLWATAAGYRSDKSIDRILNDGNYEPNNCRWSTIKQQARNKDFTKIGIVVEYNGERKNLSQWAKALHINYTTLVKRYKSGVSGHDLFVQPRVYRDSFVRAVIECRNGKAKLTNAQVVEVRDSKESGVSLSRQLRVSEATISMIRSGARRTNTG